MTPVRLEPADLRSRVKHSTTEPLRSHNSLFNVFQLLVGVIVLLCITKFYNNLDKEERDSFFYFNCLPDV